MTGRRSKAFTSAVIAVVLMGTLIGTAAASTSGEILKGVSIAGVPVGGLTAKSAEQKIRAAAVAAETRPLRLFVGERSWTRSPRELGINANVEATVKRAMDLGRRNPIEWVTLTIGSDKTDVAWVPRVDRRLQRAALSELSKQVNVQASNGSVELQGAEVIVKAPTEGVDLLMSPAERELTRTALTPKPNRAIGLPVTITPPEIDEGEVERIREQAAMAVSRPFGFTYEGKSLVLPPERVAATLRVRAVEDPESTSGSQSLVLQVDADALKNEIVAIAPWVRKPPVDASFTVADGVATLHPSQDGSTIDTSAASIQLLTLGAERADIPLTAKAEPAVFTTEQAAALKIVKRISSFTTYFDAENAPRVANIDKMASAIDGKILEPGATFSLNGATGPRTPANGYQEAGIIVDGELVPGIGGGVCQVATTLFNAVFLAGLDIVKRVNHSLHISKYPMGRDATVNYGFQDLQFRNDTEFGILLKAAVTQKAMIVGVYSSPLGRDVQTSSTEPVNHSAPVTKYVDDPTMPAGQEVVQEPGSPGFEVTVTRKVISQGQMLHSDTFVSKYRPWKRIIRRGTGPAASPSPSPNP